MAAVPFGFSLGDFVATVGVIHKATQALRASSGAQGQFHQAIADLEAFEGVLRKITTLSPKCHPDTIEAIRLCAYKCSFPLEQFLRRMRRYDCSLDWQSGTQKNMLRSTIDNCWKIKWALSMEQEVAKLKASIGPALEVIGILLQIKSLNRNELAQCEVRQVVDHTRDAFAKFEKSWLQRLDRTATASQFDTMVRHVDGQMQQILQQVPLLATKAQLNGLEAATQTLSGKVDAIAIGKETRQCQPPPRISAGEPKTHDLESVMHLEIHQSGIKQVDKKIDELSKQVKALHAVLSGN
jgi:hypothetical protein